MLIIRPWHEMGKVEGNAGTVIAGRCRFALVRRDFVSCKNYS